VCVQEKIISLEGLVPSYIDSSLEQVEWLMEWLMLQS